MEGQQDWLEWTVELQALGQAGEAYANNAFDLERFARIRELAGLMAACVAQTAADLDSGALDGMEPLRGREIEENLWRAIRYGMDGKLIDFRKGRETEARQVVDELLEWTAPSRSELGIEVELPAMNGTQRALEALADGEAIEAIYRRIATEEAASFGPAAPSG